ncbi:MAG: hypothetical protein PHF86_02220 [Candidatus Nanoarchaeia archaeon]|nr:hypothetical protein [Candidatus Nanoarchaeia archaeon]
MKIVKENINFERGQEPNKSLDIGIESRDARQTHFNKLEAEGINFFHPGDFKENEIMKKYLDHIYEIEEIIRKLQKLQISIERISGSLTIYVKGFIIYDPINHKEIVSCFGENEAKYLFKELNKFSSKDHGKLEINSGEISIYMDRDYHLDELEKNRKSL